MKGLRSHITQSLSCRQALHQRTTRTSCLPYSAPYDDSAPPILVEEIVDIGPDEVAGQPERSNPGTTSLETMPSAPTAGPGRVTVEEIEDVEEGGLPKRPWIGDFSQDAGTIYGHVLTSFEQLHEQQKTTGKGSFAPFANREEWELASFLVRSGMSQTAIEDFLTLPIVSNCICRMQSRVRSILVGLTSFWLVDSESYQTCLPQQACISTEC